MAYVISAEMKEKFILSSHNQRSFVICLNILCRLCTRLYNERCSTKFKLLSNTITDEEFGQIIMGLNNNRVYLCFYWMFEGIFLYFNR